MSQKENNVRGCKVKTSIPKSEWYGTNFTKQHDGGSSAQCLSNNTHYVLNAMELAKSLTTSHRSSKVVIRWRGTTCKRCVIDATM